jgi:uncharacterized protein (TIGR00251 family)
MSTQSTRISVYVQPRASKTGVAGTRDGWLKIRLAAPPVDNAANLALIDFLAQTLRVPKRDIRIVSGLSSRRKVIEIDGLTEAAVQAALA